MVKESLCGQGQLSVSFAFLRADLNLVVFCENYFRFSSCFFTLLDGIALIFM